MSLGVVRDTLNTKPFQQADITQAANDIVPYKANQVTGLVTGTGGPLFNEEPLFTDVAYVYERTGQLSLIPTSKRGGPSSHIVPDKATMRSLQTYRLSEEDTILAAELFRVLQFHTTNAETNLTIERNRRLMILGDRMDFTMEHLHLNALKGDVLDSDGTSLTNLFTLFGVSQETEVAWDLTNTTLGNFAKKCAGVKRTMFNNLEADAGRVDHIHVLCSPEFFDDLLSNKDIMTWAGVNPNSDYLRRSRIFGTFEWQGFLFEEYRLGTIGAAAGGTWIAADKCIMFPVGPPIYTTFFSPGETFADLGAPGLPRYARAMADPDDEFVKIKMQSYPLPICTRPKVLMKGKRGS
jgi:hypothetical protein